MSWSSSAESQSGEEKKKKTRDVCHPNILTLQAAAGRKTADW